MTLIEIENLSFADLKKQRAELITEAAKATAEELAARYVDARTDAKQRDEKLAEQGKRIDQQQALIERALKTLDEHEQRANQAERDCATANAKIAEQLAAMAALEKQLRKVESDCRAAEQLAKSRRVGLATIMQTIAPLLADEG